MSDSDAIATMAYDDVERLYADSGRDLTDDQLEQLARFRGEAYWKHATGWDAVFMFRSEGRYVYAVYSVDRGRTYAVVRVDRSSIPPGSLPVRQSDIEVLALSTVDFDAASIAYRTLADEP